MKHELRSKEKERGATACPVHASCFMLHASCRRGFSLAEILVYIALLAITFAAVVNTLLAITRSYGNLKSAFTVQRAAVTVMERVTREIRDAKAVGGGSILGAHPGKLVLDTTDAGGTSRSVEVYGENGAVQLKENGILSGPLTAGGAVVTDLRFYAIETGRSEAVRTELTVEAGSGTSFRRENFYNTTVLRESY